MQTLLLGFFCIFIKNNEKKTHTHTQEEVVAATLSKGVKKWPKKGRHKQLDFVLVGLGSPSFKGIRLERVWL